MLRRKSAADGDAAEYVDHIPAAPPGGETGPASEQWQQIEVDEAGPVFEARPPTGPDFFDFPDTECDGWSTADLTLRFASVRGARHRYHREPRQDSARAALDERTGTIVFAVADGVSRATLAHRGALAVCGNAVHRMLRGLSHDPAWADFEDLTSYCTHRLAGLTRWWLREARPSLSRIAELYATTLVAGLVRPSPGGPVAELCRIGDSGAWILDRENGCYHPLFGSGADERSAVVSTAVTPLPYRPERLDRVEVQLSPAHVLLVGTDGFGLPLGDGDGRIGSLFARELAMPPAPTWLAHVLDFSRATFDDDRTLLAVWPRSAAGPR
ncbi:protein phosphatase 2C domain-containing protein [Nocardia niigatensis]